MNRIVDLIEAFETYVTWPEHQTASKALMGEALLRESVAMIPLLIELYRAVEAADNRVFPHETRDSDYCIRVEGWDRVEAALKAIKEVE